LEIKKLVSPYHVDTLKQTEAESVEQAIVVRRRGDGKISLQQIYDTLTQMKNKGQISRQDRDGLIKDFEEYFQTHFSV
jgi:DNA-binding PadR family transcriptional regulator